MGDKRGEDRLQTSLLWHMTESRKRQFLNTPAKIPELHHLQAELFEDNADIAGEWEAPARCCVSHSPADS
jgi:hypothetical protein